MLVPLSAVLQDLAGEVGNADRVQLAGPCQVQQFTLGHNAVEKAVEKVPCLRKEPMTLMPCFRIVSTTARMSAYVA